MTSNKENLPAGLVRCGDCTHWIAGETSMGIGFCGVTKNRTIQVPESGKTVPDRQGLPPNTHPSFGYAACYPLADRRCEAFRPVSGSGL